MQDDREIVLTTCIVIVFGDAAVLDDPRRNAPSGGSTYAWLDAECARKRAFQYAILFDGTYRLKFTTRPLDELVDVAPVRDTMRFQLELPSGELKVWSGFDADEARTALSVSPGLYDVRIEWWQDRECDHGFLDSPDDYPEGDGPDGIIELLRAE